MKKDMNALKYLKITKIKKKSFGTRLLNMKLGAHVNLTLSTVSYLI